MSSHHLVVRRLQNLLTFLLWTGQLKHTHTGESASQQSLPCTWVGGALPGDGGWPRAGVWRTAALRRMCPRGYRWPHRSAAGKQHILSPGKSKTKEQVRREQRSKVTCWRYWLMEMWAMMRPGWFRWCLHLKNNLLQMSLVGTLLLRHTLLFIYLFIYLSSNEKEAASD